MSALLAQTVSAVKSGPVGFLVHREVDSLLRDTMRSGSLSARTKLRFELKTLSTILYFLSIQYDLGSISSDIGDFPYQFLLLDTIGYLDGQLYGGEKGPIEEHLMMLDCYNIMRKICDKFEELSDIKTKIPNGIRKLSWKEKIAHLYNLKDIEQQIFDVIRNNRVIASGQVDERKSVCFEKLDQQINYKKISDLSTYNKTTDSSHFQCNIFQKLYQDLEIKIQDPDCDFTKLYEWHMKLYATHFLLQTW